LTDGAIDGHWLLAWRGTPAEIGARLADATRARPEACGRLQAAADVVRALPVAEPAAVWLDLRAAEAGHLVRAARRGHFQHRYLLLPWLVARGGGLELRLVRYAHRRLQRNFSGGELVSESVGGELDELIALGPEGGLRRPLQTLSQLVDLELDLDPAVPVPAVLPATAPAVGAGHQGAVLSGAVLALILFLAAPLFLAVVGGLGRAPAPAVEPLLAPLARWMPPAAFARVAASRPEVVQALARRACGESEAWTRRHGLALACAALGEEERLQWLVAASERDPSLGVRLLAVDLLADEGDRGATRLCQLQADPAAPAEVRQQAHRRLVDLGDPRALELARRGLASAQTTPAMRRTLARAFEHADDADLLGWLEHSDPHVRAAARWALREPDRGAE
jgi:hypothetical protein